MKQHPPVPPVDEAPAALFESGHLWIQEKVDGAPLRFGLDGASDALRFASSADPFEPWREPLRVRRAVDHVRENFDAGAFEAAASDPGSSVFFGVATVHNGVAYDWDRLPPFLGFDVWDGERFLRPDEVERAFDRLGLEHVNAVEKEVDARHFDPGGYDLPESAWRDGPPWGAVFRDKQGRRAELTHPDHERSERVVSEAPDADAETLADRYVTDERVDAAVADLRADDREVTVERVRRRVLAAVARRHARVLFNGPPAETADAGAFRSRAGELVARAVGE